MSSDRGSLNQLIAHYKAFYWRAKIKYIKITNVNMKTEKYNVLKKNAIPTVTNYKQ